MARTKKITISYTEVQYTTYTKTISVPAWEAKLLKDKESLEYKELMAQIADEAAEHGETIVNEVEFTLDF